MIGVSRNSDAIGGRRRGASSAVAGVARSWAAPASAQPRTPRYRCHLLLGKQGPDSSRSPFIKSELSECLEVICPLLCAVQDGLCVTEQEEPAAIRFPTQVPHLFHSWGQEGICCSSAKICSHPARARRSGQGRAPRGAALTLRLPSLLPWTCHVVRGMPRTLWSLSSTQYFCL